MFDFPPTCGKLNIILLKILCSKVLVKSVASTLCVTSTCFIWASEATFSCANLFLWTVSLESKLVAYTFKSLVVPCCCCCGGVTAAANSLAKEKFPSPRISVVVVCDLCSSGFSKYTSILVLVFIGFSLLYYYFYK